MKKKSLILSIGHSTRTLEEFISLLKSYGVKEVVDIRTIPRSRHNPQFNMDNLAPSLRRRGIGYFHMKGLGGLRRALKDSLNTGWQNPSFRGFADYMQTREFEEGLNKLVKMTETKRVALMCAEAVPWRCHRSLVADALKVRGMEVVHIMTSTSSHPHSLTSFAKVHGGKITYPAD
jgi:uncharacterized protein (DUF488 family)